MISSDSASNRASRVLTAAYRVALLFFDARTNGTGPRKFSQHQLFAILVLKEFLGVDYRGVARLLAERDDLRRAIELAQVPHWTTLQKATSRGDNS